MISVIICTYNRCAMLKTTLESLAEMSLPPDFRWELLVVDNNSPDDTKGTVEAFAAGSRLDVRYVFEKAQGLTYARNRGINEARGDVIVFTDDDVTVEKDWLVELARVFGDATCMAAGGKILAVWSMAKPDWLQETGPYALHKVIVSFDCGDRTREAPEPPFGANMAFRREAFAKHGLFRTDLGRKGDVLLSGEETEMFLRIMNGGGKVMYAPKAIVHHPVAEERIRKSYFRSWYYNSGKEQARTETIPLEWVRYFGVPKYFFKVLAQHGWRSLFGGDVKLRFYHNLQMYKVAGRMSESRRLHLSSSGACGACNSNTASDTHKPPMLETKIGGTQEPTLQPSGSKR